MRLGREEVGSRSKRIRPKLPSSKASPPARAAAARRDPTGTSGGASGGRGSGGTAGDLIALLNPISWSIYWTVMAKRAVWLKERAATAKSMMHTSETQNTYIKKIND